MENNFCFVDYVTTSLTAANKKLDHLVIETTKNKSRLKWNSLQLYAIWIIIGSSFTGLVSFLLYFKETPK